ncbi:hypothetical protein C0991_000137 [Blastosporella zonata]|nr:hypothetical protein C0991_000137 [Blastosporella zonata]
MIPSGADSSTVEYASAVVSSAWGADISVRPDYPIVNLRPRTLSSSAAEIHQELEPRPSQEHAGRTVATIMSRIKTLGRKMKKFVSVSQKTKTERSNVEKEIGESGGAPVLGTQAAFLAEDSFVSIEEGNSTHAPENNTRTLEIEARPKTLAEIKSKRRLSLSILSGASRSVSQPNSSIVAVARTRSRPRSTVMLPVTRSSSIADEDMDNGDNGSNSVPNPGEDNLFSAMTPAPDTLPASLAAGTSAANKKKYRRFSLSALSHLVKSA